jgi:hypothetical protein
VETRLELDCADELRLPVVRQPVDREAPVDERAREQEVALVDAHLLDAGPERVVADHELGPVDRALADHEGAAARLDATRRSLLVAAEIRHAVAALHAEPRQRVRVAVREVARDGHPLVVLVQHEPPGERAHLDRGLRPDLVGQQIHRHDGAAPVGQVEVGVDHVEVAPRRVDGERTREVEDAGRVVLAAILLGASRDDRGEQRRRRESERSDAKPSARTMSRADRQPADSCSAAWAAASRAMGTRNGEQLT